MWGFKSLLPCQLLDGEGGRLSGNRRARIHNEMADAIRTNREEESQGVNPLALLGPAQKLGAYPKRLRSFFHDVRVEMKQVNWPSRLDVWSTTIVVIVTVAFFACYFFITDSLLSKAEDWLFHVVKR
jgi:preprotein translocase subunit SecE